MPSVGGITDDYCTTKTHYKPNRGKRNVRGKAHARNEKSLTDYTDGMIAESDEADGHGIDDEHSEKRIESRRPLERPPGTIGPQEGQGAVQGM